MSKALFHKVITSVENTEHTVTVAAQVGERIPATLRHVFGSMAEHMLTFENPSFIMVREFLKAKTLA